MVYLLNTASSDSQISRPSDHPSEPGDPSASNIRMDDEVHCPNIWNYRYKLEHSKFLIISEMRFSSQEQSERQLVMEMFIQKLFMERYYFFEKIANKWINRCSVSSTR